jgi:hypothetical protein
MSYDKSTRVVRELHRVKLIHVCGTWYGHQACSKVIWDGAIPDGVRRCVESGGCDMGAITQEECAINLND